MKSRRRKYIRRAPGIIKFQNNIVLLVSEFSGMENIK
jgi:hypothetical protein